MGRFLAIVGGFVLIIGLAVYMGWFGVSRTANDESRETVEITMDKAKIREDTSKVTEKAKDLAHDTKEGVKNVADKIGDSLSSKNKKESRLVVDRKSVDLEPGARVDVKVTRSGPDLKAASLTLTPSPLSSLLATGGEFGSGETETIVVIEALPGAKSGSVTLELDGGSERVDVIVKSRI